MSEETSEAAGRHVVLWVNPRSGSGAARWRVDALVRRLQEDRFTVDRCEEPDRALGAIRESQASGTLRAVVAAGGDGTLQRIVGATTPETPLVPFPLGTENLVAKHLGVSADPERLAELIRCGSTMAFDAGRANGKLFLIMASCGFDAEVVRRLHRRREGSIRRWSYAPHVIGTICRYGYPPLAVRVGGGPETPEGGEICVTARWVFVFNLPRYAMGLRLGAGADGADGLLDVCTFRRGGLGRGLYYLARVLAGRHEKSRDFRWVRGTRITVRVEESERPCPAVPYQLDGDPGGLLPLQIETVPNRVRLLVRPARGHGTAAEQHDIGGVP